MASSSDEASYINSFCGHCRFFGQCETEYGDYACWEYVEDDIHAGNGAMG